MPEQRLDLPDVALAPEEVRRHAVAEGVAGGGLLDPAFFVHGFTARFTSAAVQRRHGAQKEKGASSWPCEVPAGPTW